MNKHPFWLKNIPARVDVAFCAVIILILGIGEYRIYGTFPYLALSFLIGYWIPNIIRYVTHYIRSS